MSFLSQNQKEWPMMAIYSKEITMFIWWGQNLTLEINKSQLSGEPGWQLTNVNYPIRPLCYMQNTQASFITCKLPTSFLKDKNSQRAFTLRENKAVQGHFLVRAIYYGLHLSEPYPSTLYLFLSSEPDFFLYTKKIHGFALPTHPSITVGFSLPLPVHHQEVSPPQNLGF